MRLLSFSTWKFDLKEEISKQVTGCKKIFIKHIIMKSLPPEYTKTPIVHNKSQFNIKNTSPIHKGKFTNGQKAQETVLYQ